MTSQDSLKSKIDEADCFTPVVVKQCPYEPPHIHEYPQDWEFGGPNGTDPRVDRRWLPERRTTYTYISDRFEQLHTSQNLICDDEALDYFTTVAAWGPSFHPKYVMAKRPDGTVVTLPFEYDEATDTVYDKEWGNGQD